MNNFKIANLSELISNAANSHNLKKYEIQFEGTTDKGDGFSGQIFFVNLVSDSATIKLALKCSTTNEKIRSQMSIKEACLKEMYIYKKVLPAFEKHLLKNEKLDFMTKCYSTHLAPKSEILVFENLREQGYKLWDKQLHMPTSGIRVILEAYGQWHALSFALRHQNPEVYSKITEKNVNMFSKLCEEVKIINMVESNLEKAKKLIINEDNKEDFQELLKITNEVVRYSFTEMYYNNPERHVILHGDCWNNNYLFKFRDPENVSGVKILDWQCSGIGVPIFDLSHFIYSALDTENNCDIRETLKIYYNKFSKCLRMFSLIPEEVYSFEQIVEDWKNYSKFGLLISCFIIKSYYSQEEDIPDFNEGSNTQSFEEAFAFGNSMDERYVKRLRNNFLHYCKNVK